MKQHKLIQRVMAAILFSSLLVGCSTFLSQDTSTLTPVDPTETLKPTASSTPLPSVTPTPRPTKTDTPKPEWVTSFAEPILAAIADRPPDFEEDFSQAGPNWYLETVNCPNNGCSLSEGVLSVTAFSVDGEAWASQPLGRCCLGFKSFVMQVDVNPEKLSGENSANIFYNANIYEGNKFTNKFEYYFELKNNRRWSSWINPPGHVNDYGLLPSSIPLSLTFTLISRNSMLVVYLNYIPVSHVENAGGQQYQPEFELGAWSDGNTDALVEYDNFKVWNLDNIPSLP